MRTREFTLGKLLDFEVKAQDESPTVEQRPQVLAALQRVLSRATRGSSVSDEALRRENIYDEQL